MSKDQFKTWLAWVMLVGSIIGWPLSIVWFAKDEPITVLSLSWGALIYTAVTTLFVEDDS